MLERQRSSLFQFIVHVYSPRVISLAKVPSCQVYIFPIYTSKSLCIINISRLYFQTPYCRFKFCCIRVCMHVWPCNVWDVTHCSGLVTLLVYVVGTVNLWCLQKKKLPGLWSIKNAKVKYPNSCLRGVFPYSLLFHFYLSSLPSILHLLFFSLCLSLSSFLSLSSCLSFPTPDCGIIIHRECEANLSQPCEKEVVANITHCIIKNYSTAS